MSVDEWHGRLIVSSSYMFHALSEIESLSILDIMCQHRHVQKYQRGARRSSLGWVIMNAIRLYYHM